MSAYGIITLSFFTLVGIKYLIDMVRFAMGYEINGKRRKPLFGPKKRQASKKTRPAPQEVHYDWEKEFEVKPANGAA